MSWRRVGTSLLLMAVVLVWILRQKILPFQFFILAALYCVAMYFTTVRRISYRWAPLVIAMLGIPMGAFLYLSHNSIAYWLTYALAIVAGTGVSLLVFPMPKRRSS